MNIRMGLALSSLPVHLLLRLFLQLHDTTFTESFDFYFLLGIFSNHLLIVKRLFTISLDLSDPPGLWV